MSQREPYIFADCQNGNHSECLVEFPETAHTKRHHCECECHAVKPPVRYCVRDRKEIDPKRVMRGSSFCSNECRREDLKERRDYRASKACRLCGRPAKHGKPQIISSEVCDGGTARETASQQEGASA